MFASCCRRVVVSDSRCVVNFSPLGGTHALRHNPFLQSMKSGGSLARNARFGASNFQGERSFSHFAWQAQDFGSFLLEKLISKKRGRDMVQDIFISL